MNERGEKRICGEDICFFDGFFRGWIWSYRSGHCERTVGLRLGLGWWGRAGLGVGLVGGGGADLGWHGWSRLGGCVGLIENVE